MADDQTIEELTRAIQALQLQMKNNKTVDPKEIDRLDKALKAASRGTKSQTDAQKLQTEAFDKGSKGATRFAGALGGTVRNLGNFASSTIAAAASVQEQQESFSSLNGSIDLTAGVLKTAGKAVGGVTDSLGEALKGIPVLGGVIGGLVSGAGKAAAALAEATADVGAQIAKQMMAQLDSAGSAFRMVAQAGGLGADGMTTLANQAIGAGISFKNFAEITKNSSEGLAFAFGTATTGVDRFANISKAMTPFRRELEAMGIGAKQQNEMTANYLKLQARTARVDQMSSAELAQGSAAYAKELSTLARLTGVSVDEAEKELQGQLRNARFNGAVQDINERVGLKAGKNVELAAATLTKQNEAIGKGFQDIMAGNALTDEAQGFILAAGERGQRAVEALQNGQISAAEATAEINRGMKDRVEALGGPGALAKIIGAGTAFDTVGLGMLEANKRIIPTTKEIEKMGEMTKNSLNPQDAATKGLVDGQMAMRNFATEVNSLTLKALPGMGKAATTVASTMTNAMKEINKMIEMGAENYAKNALGMGDKSTVETGDVLATTGTGLLGGAAAGAATGAALGLIGGPLAPLTSSLGAIAGALLGGLGGAATGFFAGKEGAGQDMFDFAETFGEDSWLGSLFNEKKAIGGPVQAGGTYTVGEKGPEMLVAGMDGNIIPNDAMEGIIANLLGSVGGLEAMAGPAGNLTSADFGGLQDALAGNATSFTEQGAGSAIAQASNTLAEAQLNRLDTIASSLIRSVNVQTEILQAAHR